MLDWTLPVWGDGLVFLAAAAVVGVAGTKLADLADRLADRTGLGEAVTGAVFLGLITALPGLVASVVAALKGHPALALSNAMGGIAIQTTALAAADVAHRRANLEHAAASATNLIQTVSLLLLLTVVLLGVSSPDTTVGWVHPVTLLLLPAAGFAFWVVYRTGETPMWTPTQTPHTVADEPDPDHEEQRLAPMVVGLALGAAATAVGGAAIAEAAENVVAGTAIPEAVVGGLFMAAATSLPEAVTSVAAVRVGAPTLAVSDIVGGNFFDVLFVAAADVAFLQGSLYHGQGVGIREVFLIALTILLNLVLLLGLLYRQREGPLRIGWDGVTMVLLYLGGFLVLSLAM